MNDISKTLPAPANDNVYEERWPIREEYLAKRLGNDAAVNELSWACVEYISDIWNRIRDETEPYYAPGTFRISGLTGRTSCFGNPLALRGAERTAHAIGIWSRVDRETNGRFWLVKRAIIDRCEMRELATDVRNRAKRAAAGRARLIEALPLVAEAIRLLDVAEAA